MVRCSCVVIFFLGRFPGVDLSARFFCALKFGTHWQVAYHSIALTRYRRKYSFFSENTLFFILFLQGKFQCLGTRQLVAYGMLFTYLCSKDPC